MGQLKKAFSLIELMVVISIIGLLAGVAVPSYKTYTLKSKVVAAYQPIVSQYKLEIANMVNAGETINNIYVANPTNSIQCVHLNTSGIYHYIGIRINRSDLGISNSHEFKMQYRGEESNGVLKWTCLVDSQYTDYVPECTNGGNLASSGANCG